MAGLGLSLYGTCRPKADLFEFHGVVEPLALDRKNLFLVSTTNAAMPSIAKTVNTACCCVKGSALSARKVMMAANIRPQMKIGIFSQGRSIIALTFKSQLLAGALPTSAHDAISRPDENMRFISCLLM
jgi:hypothetical protein